MKPSIPKGPRDFSPQEMVKRNYIFDTIRKVYQMHGYQPIETPAFENLETLTGKYGEEGDRLIFKILNSGDVTLNFAVEEAAKSIAKLAAMHVMPKVSEDELDKIASSEVAKTEYYKNIRKGIMQSVEKALRYDLTVPFARYVVQHRNDITFPFKRYQIQPVWRADRPQKGRYREFYQCDADVIGSDSLLNEVELIQIIDEVFTKLGVPVIIKINNRKILQGIAEYIGAPDRMIDIATAIDKLDKIEWDGVQKELIEKGFNVDQIGKLINVIAILKPNQIGTVLDEIDTRSKYVISILTLNKARESLVSNGVSNGVAELLKICESIEIFNKELSNKLEFDISLARGLNYYTGTIIEVKVDASKCASQFTSSICGGGRYDDLTGIFGLPDVSGVGISFGADRIYDVIEELGLFPKEIAATTKVLLINFGENEAQYCLKVVKDLHAAGISAELYPDAKKINKQFEYADKRGIPYVVSIGEKEIESGRVALKNLQTKEQIEIPLNDLISHIK